jgi:isoquinoline 1-oxidoreductase beta subunit
MEKDPVEFRLELLQRAQTDPVGNRNDYDANRYAGVIELARDKSNWANTGGKEKRGFAAYFCHNTYVAEVLELKPNSTTEVNNVIAAVDCGIVVNPDSAINMAEGGIVDGIGNALYGDLEFKDGTPSANNFDKYKIIRQTEAPKSIEVYFVENNEAPTGLGEPLFPPVFAALSNAISASTDQRVYEQPFVKARAVKG